jgi:Tol biopolymer transport system component
LYTKPSTGAGAEQTLLISPNLKVPYSWSADGHFVLYGEEGSQTSRDLWALPIEGDRKPVAVVNSPFYEGNGQFSPDGRWVAYHSNESGRYEVYVVPFPAGGGKWKISTAGGISPRWRHDGKELFFIGPDGQMMAAAISGSGASIETVPPTPLFQTRIVGGGTNSGNKHQYAVSPDVRFLINVAAGDSTVAPITLILNWSPEPGK